MLATNNPIQVQLCPKCNGQGIVSRPPWIAGDVHQWSGGTASSFVCNVCNGARVIYPPQIGVANIVTAPLPEITSLKEENAKLHEQGKESLLLYNSMTAQIAKYRKALEKIAKWEMPVTGKYWPDKEGKPNPERPMSYGVCYGSNGERDFIKSIAEDALNK